MIILDTNIVSEVMRPQPNDNVMQWLESQDIEILYITSVSMAEIYFGLYRMPKGKRKSGLLEKFQQILENSFQNRLLDFTHEQAHIYAKFCSHAEKIGKPMAIADAQIASIACHHQATLATRNTKDSINCEIDLVNPFLN